MHMHTELSSDSAVLYLTNGLKVFPSHGFQTAHSRAWLSPLVPNETKEKLKQTGATTVRP